MPSNVDEQIAHTMEVELQLLPHLPELLADLEELGTSAVDIVNALRGAAVEAGSSVLDLGCGKGAVAVALAERLSLWVEGIDAFPPFLDAARALAAERGVAAQCEFREGDIRDFLGQSGQYDALLLLSVGPVSGDHQSTVRDLRRLVRPGGIIVIEDAFLADAAACAPEWEGYATRAETLRRLTAFGDVLIHETVCAPDQTRSLNEGNTALIRQRARQLQASHPDLAVAIDAYVARQERETQILGQDLLCAVWALRRL